MRLIPSLLSLAVASALTATTAAAQAPLSTDTHGYLDFVGAKSGAPTANNVYTGPYNARFGPTSGTVGSSVFDVFCFDWIGRAGDSKIQILTFHDAVNSATAVPTSLRLLFADNPEGSAGGLTLAKLNSAAWLTTQMTTANQSEWNEMHVALWNIFWDPGVGSPKLPGLGFGNAGEPTAQFWYDEALKNDQFNARGFRIFAAVDNNGRLLTERQMFLGEVTPVPEPGAAALVVVGLVAMGIAVRRKRAV